MINEWREAQHILTDRKQKTEENNSRRKWKSNIPCRKKSSKMWFLCCWFAYLCLPPVVFWWSTVLQRPLLFPEEEAPTAESAAPTHPLAGEHTRPTARAPGTPPPTLTATVTHNNRSQAESAGGSCDAWYRKCCTAKVTNTASHYDVLSKYTATGKIYIKPHRLS